MQITAEWAQFYLNVVSTILLTLTLIYGVKATKAAIRAAESSEKGVEIGLRAYCKISHDHEFYLDERRRNIVGSVMRPTIENTGSTPAVNCSFIYTYIYVPQSPNNEIKIDREKIFSNKVSGFEVGSRDKQRMYGPKLDHNVIEDLDRNMVRVFFRLCVEYSDVFKNDAIYQKENIFEYHLMRPLKSWAEDKDRPLLGAIIIDDPEIYKIISNVLKEIQNSEITKHSML